MEGDVETVMLRPEPASADDDNVDIGHEQEKWDAWDAQKGVSRTEAKRKYIEALIDTMHRYAGNSGLVEELEFVWNQIKNNSPTSSNSSPRRSGNAFSQPRQFTKPQSGNDGPLRVLSPMSQDDEAEILSEKNIQREDHSEARWRRKVEAAMVKMTAEMAALREQISSGREWKGRQRNTVSAWLSWLVFTALRHFFVDAILLGVLLYWMRKRKDRRFEDLVREGLRICREYARRLLPSR
jgi:hypothetical protein